MRYNEDGTKMLPAAFIIGIHVVLLLSGMLFGGLILNSVENTAEGSMIHSEFDGVWTVFMTMTTIGFGDFYPVTALGRLVVMVSFFFGAYNVGVIINTMVSRIGNKDSSNDFLMRSIAELLRKMEAMESCMEYSNKEHHLDAILLESSYKSDQVTGRIALGRDSSGLHIVSIYGTADSGDFNRWIPCTGYLDALRRYRTIIKDPNLV
jgi:hypothetical protein